MHRFAASPMARAVLGHPFPKLLTCARVLERFQSSVSSTSAVELSSCLWRVLIEPLGALPLLSP